MYRLILLLCSLAFCSLTVAAEPPRLSERSLLIPGLWWNPSASGNGLDLHLSGETLGLLWYTFRPDGSPTWYVAGGDFDDQGVVEAELLEPSWGEAGISTRVIGSIRVTRLHAERAQLEYQIGTELGTWNIVPVQYTAQRDEIDSSGAYYLPQSSGFGLSIDQFGAIQTAVYYAYDQAGQPQWFLGVREAAQGAIQFDRFRRSCPRCSSASLSSDLSLAATLSTEPGLATVRIEGAQSQLSATFSEPAPLTLLTLPVSARGADYRPARFDDAESLERFLETSMLDPEVWNWTTSGVDFSPAPPPASAPQNSTTNLVEAGVDEADRVKTDGTYVYVYDDSTRRIDVGLRLDPSTPHLATVLLPAANPLPPSQPFHNGQMFLTPDRLVFLATQSSPFFIDASAAICPPPPEWWFQSKTAVRIYDRSHPHQVGPDLVWSADIDGELIASRMIDDQLYLVQRFTPFVDGFQYHSASSQQQEANRALLQQVSAEDLLPKAALGSSTLPWLAAHKVFLPPSADRRPQPDFTVITRINLQDPGDRETLGLVNGVSAIYVSPDAIYLTTTRQDQTQFAASGLVPDWFISTEVHRVSLKDGGLELDASGAVDGWLTFDPLQQPFRLSEHEGVLRVLSVKQLGWWGMNLLTQLEESALMPGLLKTISTLPNPSRPQPLGKPYETLHASRFVGDRLFASTFRVIDPFYVIDLSDLADPRIAGEVELPGFAEYLHPVNEHLVLGVGRHADSNQGLTMGVKLTLFDVGDPSQPRVVDNRVIGERGSYSALFNSHHAFSALRIDDGRLRIGVPIRVHGEPEPDPNSLPDGFNFEPFTLGGLHAFDVVEDAEGGHLESKGVLVTARAVTGGQGSWDDSGDAARSILFPSGVLYFSDDEAWSASWDALDDPIGPM